MSIILPQLKSFICLSGFVSGFRFRIPDYGFLLLHTPRLEAKAFYSENLMMVQWSFIRYKCLSRAMLHDTKAITTSQKILKIL